MSRSAAPSETRRVHCVYCGNRQYIQLLYFSSSIRACADKTRFQLLLWTFWRCTRQGLHMHSIAGWCAFLLRARLICIQSAYLSKLSVARSYLLHGKDGLLIIFSDSMCIEAYKYTGLAAAADNVDQEPGREVTTGKKVQVDGQQISASMLSTLRLHVSAAVSLRVRVSS